MKKMSRYRSAGACPPRLSCRRDLLVSIPPRTTDGFPVGETSRSRCNTLNLIKVRRTLRGCGAFFYRHSGPTDLKEVFDRPVHGEGQALALR